MYFDRTDVPRMNGVGLYRYELSDRARVFPGISALTWELRCQLYSQPFVFSSLLSPRNQHGNITANARGLSDRERERALPCIEIVQFSFTQLLKLSWTLKWAWSVSFIVSGSHWHPGYELLWCGGYIKYQVSRIKHKNQWRHAQSDIQHLYLHTSQPWLELGQI